MTLYLDSSVLVAALIEDEPSHEACLRLLRRPSAAAWSHALAETFATLTGGRLGLRLSPGTAATLVEESLVPRLKVIELGSAEIRAAIRGAEAGGVRGGAIYDFLHMAAARKCGANTLYTLNARHFQPLTRPGDPGVEAPAAT